MKLGKRHVRRGHLAKIRDEKRGWVARMREGPPVRRMFQPSADVLDALRVGGTCIDLSPRVAWDRAAEPLDTALTPGAAAALVTCDAIDFGGGYPLLAETRRGLDPSRDARPRLFAFDYFVDPVQIQRASRLGADAVWLVARLPDIDLAALVGVARDEGLEPVVECASVDDAAAARSLGVRIAAFSCRDRDHHRSVAPDPLLAEELARFPLALAVSTSDTALAGFHAVFARPVC